MATARFGDPATFSLGVATDLRFFSISFMSGVGLASVWSPASASASSATAARWSAVSLSGPRQEVTDWETWDPPEVFSSDLRGLLAPAAGLDTAVLEGSAATDLRDNFFLALPLVAGRGWLELVLAMSGTAMDLSSIIAEIIDIVVSRHPPPGLLPGAAPVLGRAGRGSLAARHRSGGRGGGRGSVLGQLTAGENVNYK